MGNGSQAVDIGSAGNRISTSIPRTISKSGGVESGSQSNELKKAAKPGKIFTANGSNSRFLSNSNDAFYTTRNQSLDKFRCRPARDGQINCHERLLLGLCCRSMLKRYATTTESVPDIEHVSYEHQAFALNLLCRGLDTGHPGDVAVWIRRRPARLIPFGTCKLG